MTLSHFAIIAVLRVSARLAELCDHRLQADARQGYPQLRQRQRRPDQRLSHHGREQRPLLVLLGDIAKARGGGLAIGMMLGRPDRQADCGHFRHPRPYVPAVFRTSSGGKGVLVGAVMLAFFDWRVFAIALVPVPASSVIADQMDLARLHPGRDQLPDHACRCSIMTSDTDRDGGGHGGGGHLHAPLEHRTHPARQARTSSRSRVPRPSNRHGCRRRGERTTMKVFVLGHRRLGHRAGDSAA